MERKAIILLVCAWLSVLSSEAGINLIQDGSFEIGVAEGTNNAYYNLGGQTIWRAWPYIGFQVDTTQKYDYPLSYILWYQVVETEAIRSLSKRCSPKYLRLNL